jgi:outer membrane protein
MTRRRFAPAVAAIIWLATIEAVVPAAAFGQAPPLTLREAITEALNRNRTIVAARAGIDQAQQSLRLADDAFGLKLLPNMSGALGRTTLSNQAYGLNMSQKFVGGTQISGGLSAASYRNQLGNYFYSDTTLQVTQPLLRGFGTVTRRSLFDAEGRAGDSRRQLALAEQQVAQDVAAAYYAVVVQNQTVAVAKTAIERAVNLRDASRARLATGRVTQLDVLRAEQLVAQAEAQILDVEGALADARERLTILIGRPIDGEFTVVDAIPTDVEAVTSEVAIASALSRRAELAVARGTIDEADRAVQAARNQLRPQVDVGVAVTRQETAPDLSSAFGTNGFRGAMLATVSMPIDRTVDDVGLQTALIERSRRQQELESIRDRITQEARQAVRRQVRAQRAVELARASVGLAERELEIATFRFQRGLSNSLEVVSAQGTLRGVQSQEVAARAEIALARIALRAAMGVLDPRQDIE